MALNIVNRRVEEKAIQASEITNVNKTAAVEIALDYYLAHHKSGQNKRAINREITILFDELIELPVLDKRSADDILDYDENGLP